MGEDPTLVELFVQAGTSLTSPARINNCINMAGIHTSGCKSLSGTQGKIYSEQLCTFCWFPDRNSWHTYGLGSQLHTPCCCRQRMTPTFPLLPAALLPSFLAPCSPFCLVPSSSLSVTKSSLPFVLSAAGGFFSGKSAAKKDSAQNQFPVHTGSASPHFALKLLPVTTCHY